MEGFSSFIRVKLYRNSIFINLNISLLSQTQGDESATGCPINMGTSIYNILEATLSIVFYYFKAEFEAVKLNKAQKKFKNQTLQSVLRENVSTKILKLCIFLTVNYVKKKILVRDILWLLN